MATTNTNKAPRITKAQRFQDIKALLSGTPATFGTTIEDALKFCDAELTLLSKKNSSDKKLTKSQEENEGFKILILDFLLTQENPVTCTEIQKGIAEFSDFNNQKIAAMMRQLKDAQKVKKEIGKGGKSLFSLA